MKWEGRRQSGNVEDRRFGKKAGGVGIVGILIALAYAYFTGDTSALLQTASSALNSQQTAQESPETGAVDKEKEFVSVVLADTEDAWTTVFAKIGRNYEKPKLVLFSDYVDSACGRASKAVGPFYCPQDQKLYIDLGFFKQLSQDLGANGDFAQAYVIAHEVGHHVQNLLGFLKAGQSNEESVTTELQADCFAGMWAKLTDTQKDVLEQGDLEEALNAAAAVGDDRLQQKAQGYVTPDSFTHGTADQRANAFSKGFASGEISSCAPNISRISGR